MPSPQEIAKAKADEAAAKKVAEAKAKAEEATKAAQDAAAMVVEDAAQLALRQKGQGKGPFASAAPAGPLHSQAALQQSTSLAPLHPGTMPPGTSA